VVATTVSGSSSAAVVVKVSDSSSSQQSAAKYKMSATGHPPDVKAVQSALDEVNQAVQKVAPGLEFSIDKQLGSTVIKVVDSQTKEVLRQIPGEEVLRIARAIDKMQGHLVRLTA